jgi:hypothetical protein
MRGDQEAISTALPPFAENFLDKSHIARRLAIAVPA